jgi:phage shock protein A
MLHIAIQIKELASSNLNALVQSAGNPVRMLRLLQSELQESIVALQGDLSRNQRRAERLETEAAQLAARVADWTDKARIAMDHKREDLARAALLTREQTQADADRARGEASAAAATAEDIAKVIGQLEAKLAETRERIAEETLRRQGEPRSVTATSGSGTTRSERVMDRIGTLEKRVDFATEKRPDPAPASVEAEIEQLRREAKVNAELAEMKAATRPAPAKKKARK